MTTRFERYRGAAFVLVLGAALRLPLLGRPRLFIDEAYYWDWSRRLALGYFDHPPAIAWLIRLGTTIAGTSELGVRIAPALIGLLLPLMAWLVGHRLAGPRAALLAGVLSVVLLPLVIATTIALPDGLLLVCWGAALAALIRAAERGRHRNWALVGATVGIGLLAKYVMGLFVAIALLALLLTPTGRRQLRRPGPYLALLIALVVWSPNLWWNARHGWVSFAFQIGHVMARANAEGPPLPQPLGQTNAIGMSPVAIHGNLVSPPVGVLLLVGAVWAFGRGARRGEIGLLLLGLGTAVPLVLVSALHGMPHWALPAYLSATIACAVGAARLADDRGGPFGVGVRVGAWAVVALSGLYTGYELAPVLYPEAGAVAAVLPASSVVERPSLTDPDLLVFMRAFSSGWERVGALVDEAMARLPPDERSRTLVVGPQYFHPGEAAFYAQGRPRAYGPSHQYALWGAPECDDCRVILVHANTPAEGELARWKEALCARFAEVREVGVARRLLPDGSEQEEQVLLLSRPLGPGAPQPLWPPSSP